MSVTGVSIPALLLPLIALLLNHIQTGEAIGCFVCTSINGSEPRCEDTFSNTGNFYKQNCVAGRKDRNGTFPGTQCIKFKTELDNYTVLVRNCVVDSGGTNSDTEIGRESHCWIVSEIQFGESVMRGCSVACSTDGCNHTESKHRGNTCCIYLALLLAILVIL